MFFGLLFIIALVVITIVLLLLKWLFSNNAFVKIALGLWTVVIVVVIGLLVNNYFTKPMHVEHADVYGDYVINRDMYPGKQADWQYNHYRFTIKENGNIYFYETENDQIIKTYQGTIAFHPAYKSPRLIINIEHPRHHIIEDYPTLIRKPRSFDYVFKSPLYGNVFFEKGTWEPID